MKDQTIDKEVTSQILKFLNCDEDTTTKFQDDKNIIFDENIMRKALKNSKKSQLLSSEKQVPSL